VARVKVKLIGLIEPVDESARAAFEEWYLGNHVQDVSHTPGIVSATVHRMVKSFSSDDPPEYVTIYEFDSPQQGDAEEALFTYPRGGTRSSEASSAVRKSETNADLSWRSQCA